MKKNKGFTLIELTIVALIIVGLAAMAMPSYFHSMERARCAQAMENLTLLRKAATTHFAKYGSYTNMDDIEEDLEPIIGTSRCSLAVARDWTYLILANGTTTYTLEALRDGGEHDGDDITLNEADLFAGAYPRQTYGFL